MQRLIRPRFAIVVGLLVATAAILQARRQPERIAIHQELGSLPTTVNDWRSRDIPIPSDIRQVLGPGEFLERVYQAADSRPVDLFLAYFPSQRTGATIHSPKNCLPGSGWTPISSERVKISLNGRAVSINEYVVANGSAQNLVLYWYQAHGRVVASEYAAKYYLVRDAIAMNRTDGALVRIITAIPPDGTPAVAEARAIEFAHAIGPLLNRYIPD
jgi:EpsI family protein